MISQMSRRDRSETPYGSNVGPRPYVYELFVNVSLIILLTVDNVYFKTMRDVNTFFCVCMIGYVCAIYKIRTFDVRFEIGNIDVSFSTPLQWRLLTIVSTAQSRREMFGGM